MYAETARALLQAVGKECTARGVFTQPEMLPAVAALDTQQVQPSGWAGIIYSAVFSIVIAYIIWNSGVKKIGSSRTSLYSNLIPVIGAITAAIFLGEAITPLKVVGAAIIFLGLHLARTARLVRKV